MSISIKPLLDPCTLKTHATVLSIAQLEQSLVWLADLIVERQDARLNQRGKKTLSDFERLMRKAGVSMDEFQESLPK
jgi:hypothetical protein